MSGKEVFFPDEHYPGFWVSEEPHLLIHPSTTPLPRVIISTGTWFPHGKTSLSKSNQGDTQWNDDSATGNV